jgi:uncharacterized repeat protein (TIGR02543 family)
LSTVQSREGYTFTEWNTQSDGNGDTITASSIVTKDEDHTLYAKWKTHTYKVRFHANESGTE